MDSMSSPTPATPPAAIAHPSAKNLFTAIAWTAAAKWIAQVVSWASTLIVLRLLKPDDFGLVGMAGTYLGLVMLLSEFGIGAAVVALRDIDAAQTRQLHTLAVMLGCVGTLLSLAVAVPISRFFKTPEVAVLIAVMSCGFAITAFRSVPFSLLQKDMQFRTLSWMEALQSLVQATACVALAWFGAGYWSLVLSGLAGSITATILPFVWRPISLAWPNFRAIAESMGFSWRVLVSRLSWYCFSNADFVVAGRVLGRTELGIYTVAWTIANMPGEKIASMVTRVTPAFFSAVQSDKAALRRYLTMLTETLSIAMFPIVTGLALVTPDFVRVAMGEKWLVAVFPIQLLAVYTFVRSIVSLLPQINHVVGLARFGMWHSLASLAVLPASFFFFSRWGVPGIAFVWVTIYPLLLIPLFIRTLRAIDMPVAEYLRVITPALLASAIMTIVLFGVRASLPADANAIVRLTMQVATGAAVYGLALWMFFPQRVLRYVEFTRRFVWKRQPAQA